jgi:hypothetical protein
MLFLYPQCLIIDHDEQLLLPHQIKAEPDVEQELENN